MYLKQMKTKMTFLLMQGIYRIFCKCYKLKAEYFGKAKESNEHKHVMYRPFNFFLQSKNKKNKF